MKTFRNTMVALLLILCLSLFVFPAAQAAAAEDDLSLAKYYLKLYEYFPLGADVEAATSIEQLEKAMQKYDPFFHFLDVEDVEEMSQEFDGSYLGIGVLMQINDAEEIVIKAIYGDTVAARAGFMAGDIIEGIDDVPVKGKSLTEVSKLLQGEGVVDSIVNITIRRGDWSETYALARKEMETPHLAYWMLEDGVGYMVIELFTFATDKQVEAGIDYLSSLGMNKLVLDLRDCPGGVMYAAAEAASLFTGGGIIYYSLGKDGLSSVHYKQPQLAKTNAPLAVLINEDTASAAEFFSGTLQDKGRGYLIGMPTYGKGYSQSLVELPSDNALYFTTSKFVSSDFQDIAVWGGINPDKLVRDWDQQLESAIAWVKAQNAVAVTLEYTINSGIYRADGESLSGCPLPFISEGAAYVPAGITLGRLGWTLTWDEGICYAQNGARRLILDHLAGEILCGNSSAATITVGNDIFLPAAFLRNLDYEVAWDNEAQKITISRKE